MAEKNANRSNEHDTEVREHLANERTLLSWVRTGVGLPLPGRWQDLSTVLAGYRHDPSHVRGTTRRRWWFCRELTDRRLPELLEVAFRPRRREEH
jgi:hypothetical protein